MYNINSVISSLSSSIQASERLIHTSRELTARARAYDAAFQSLAEALSEDWIADSLTTADHAILVVELQDIKESLSRTNSLPFAYGRMVEFARFTLRKLEHRRDSMGITC